MTLPQFQTALVVQGPGKLAIEHEVPIPKLEPDMVMVKTAAVAINPADAKMLDFSAVPGAVHGYDFAGTIVALGEEALAEGRLQIGDRVAGLVHGMNVNKPGVGAFAQYVGAYHDLLLKIPDSMSFEDAASFGTGVATASLSLFHEMRVPATLEQLSASIGSQAGEDYVLVAGGSTATGTRAIQMLKLAGLRPIATCSPSNNALVIKAGAEKVFNYASETCAADIRAYTQGELAYALDCVTSAETMQLCYGALGRAGGRYVCLEPFQNAVAQTRSLTVSPSWVMVLTVFGHKVSLDGEYGREARPEDRAFGRAAFAAMQSLLDRGLVTTHPTKALPGGWDGVVQGVDTIRTQALSGYKLVYGVA